MKYRRIYESLKAGIESGDLEPGSKLRSDEALAEEYGASRNTVIRALCELRDEGLVGRIQGAGTFVRDAKPAVRGRFVLIASGRIEPSARFTVFGRVEQHLRQRLQAEHGIALLHALHDAEPGRGANGGGDLEDGASSQTRPRLAAAEDAIRAGVQAAFLLPDDHSPEAVAENAVILERLAAAKVPVVLLDCHAGPPEARPPRRDVVGVDNFLAGLEVGEHLAAAQPKKVLMLSYAGAPDTIRKRFEGVATALGGGVELVYASPPTIGDARVAEAMEAHQPDAVVAKDDGVAAAVMRFLYQRGLRAPDDVRVVGFDDSPIASELMVPLTTYAQPVEALARAAVDLAVARVAEPGRPLHRVSIGGRLIVRDSA